eukprot:g8003.t1
MPEPEPPPADIDVVVVGGGLAGLATAERLASAKNVTVIVLEAQDRVGGRMLTVGGCDLGAMFVGATHTRLRALIRRLRVGGLRPLPARGAKVMVNGGCRHTFHGTIPPLGLAALVELQVGVLWRLDWLATRVDPAAPGSCRHAAAWDALSVGQWARRHLWTAAAREALEASCCLVFGCWP